MSERTDQRYVFATAAGDERDRLRAQAALWDPLTFGHLAATGVTAGWRCLEVGAGTGTVAAWLLDQVGPDGEVVATDIETRWLEPLSTTNLRVLHHNVHDDPLEETGYDLIHTRLVLEHLPRREQILDKLVAALRPGGWLVIEDYDLRTTLIVDPPNRSWTSTAEAVIDALQRAGCDPLIGVRLLGLLRAAGLSNVTASGHVNVAAVPDLAPAFGFALDQLRPAMLAAGSITAEDADAAAAMLRPSPDPPTAYSPMLVTASGQLTATGDAR